MTASSVRPAVVRPRVRRHAVRDREGSVVGYELLVHPATGAAPADADAAATSLLRTAFGEYGLHRLGNRRMLYVNPTRAMLTSRDPLPFDPHHVALELLDPLDVDDELLGYVRDLKSRGFRILINMYVGGDAYLELLPLVDVVKVDLAAVGPDLPMLVQHVRATTPRARLLAEGVRDEVELAACLELGFALVQGPYFEQRERLRDGRVTPAAMVCLQLLAALSDPASTTTELERIVSADPAISLRVLQTVNSVAGARYQVHSMRQAVVLVGRRALSAWVLLAALNGHPEHAREDLVAILTRAGACELLSGHLPGVDPLTAYSAGLVSGIVEVLGADPAQIARDTRLDEALTGAVLRHEGEVGALLYSVEQLVRHGAPTAVLPQDVQHRAHVDALALAVETVDSLQRD